VAVPGVMTRTTSRRNKLFARAGLLHLIADRDLEAGADQARDVAFAAWYGTPHMGIGCPFSRLREVRVI